MPFIEGIGDEVTIILGGFFLCIVLMFAWLSTHTADIPLLREVGVIVVELSQRRSRTQNAVSEEPAERNNADGSIEHGNASGNGERQQSETEIRAGEISESQLIAGVTSENNNIAVGARTSASPSSDEIAGSRGTTDATAASGLSPELAEAVSITADQAALSSSSQQIRRKSGDETSPNHLKESETLVPKATVVVDDSKGFTYPTEEEIRQRRVQYFQANKSTEGGNGVTHSSPDDNKPTSLSEFSSPDSDHTRHLLDNSHSSYLPSTVGATLADSAITSRTSHPASTPTAGSSSFAANSPDEVINDSQIISEQENAPSSKIRVKLKYMNETQRLVYAEPLDTIGDFRRTHFQAELEDNKWVRFIYNGQDLRDDARTLQACNIGDNCTMHCLITTQTQSHMPRTAAAEEDEDSFMGAMMYPLFTVIIMIVWYFRFTYRQYFSAMSTVCLIGISFLLVLSYISSLRTSDRIPPQRRLGPTTSPPPGVEVREEHQHVD